MRWHVGLPPLATSWWHMGLPPRATLQWHTGLPPWATSWWREGLPPWATKWWPEGLPLRAIASMPRVPAAKRCCGGARAWRHGRRSGGSWACRQGRRSCGPRAFRWGGVEIVRGPATDATRPVSMGNGRQCPPVAAGDTVLVQDRRRSPPCRGRCCGVPKAPRRDKCFPTSGRPPSQTTEIQQREHRSLAWKMCRQPQRSRSVTRASPPRGGRRR